MSAIDLSTLQKPLGLHEARQEFRTYSVAWRVGFTALLFVAIVPFLVFILFAPAVLRDGGAVLFLMMLAGGGLYGLRDMYGEINENALTKRIARQNGMIYRRDYYDQAYPGFAFRTMFVPRSIRTNETLFIELGHLRPEFSKRRSQASITYTYLRIKLPKQLPHMILQRKTAASLVTFRPEGERLQLEGEFGDRFDLYVPTGYERDALYIFTPDVMERFIDAARDFDCEIVGDELYFYSHKKINLTKPKNLARLFQIVRHVLQKFKSQSGKYTDERVTGVQAGDGVVVEKMKLRTSAMAEVALGIVILLAVVAVSFRLSGS